MIIWETQLHELRDRFGGVDTQALPNGSMLVTVHELTLPQGWNKPKTSIRFLVPPAYPYAALDCFWADVDLRLGGGSVPQNANVSNPIPDVGAPGLWFSWHLLQPWNANRDTLSSWMNTIMERFRRLQ